MKRRMLLNRVVFATLFLGIQILSGNVKAESEIINRSSSNRIYSYMNITRSDISHYKKIFHNIKEQNFDAADKEISKLDNNILLGHVLAQKYLSKKYKSNFGELQEWLKKYSDHPQTGAIYRLALRKGKKEDLVCSYTPQKTKGIYGWMEESLDKLKPVDKKFIIAQVTAFRKAIIKGKTKTARIILENKRFKSLVPTQDYDSMVAYLATKYLTDNYNKIAFRWASAASNRSKNATASWIAGLAAWQLKDYKSSSIYFRRLAQSGNDDEWLVAAGAYWAYRADTKLKKDERALRSLILSAKYKRTFYGILANYQLGNPLKYNWTALSYLNDFNQNDYIDEILSSSSLQRALLLLHAKQPELAEKELRYDLENMSDKQKEVALFIAGQYKMHALGMLISNQLKDEERDIAYDSIAYPIPVWTPKGGWKIEKSLLLALTRQESSFRPKVKSAAGACGLMQLMPNTAVHITKDKSLKKNTEQLLEAEYNMALGQKYVNYLLEKPFIDGNLFYLMAAYNAGPGNLVKWQKNVHYQNDPLLFIEIIPARETRIYIERVMANMWIYQSRFGQELSGIKALSQGKWPYLKEN